MPTVADALSLTELKWLVWIMLGWTFWLASGHAPQPEKLTAPMKCRDCGGEMRVVEVTYQPFDSLGVRPEHALTYDDSG